MQKVFFTEELTVYLNQYLHTVIGLNDLKSPIAVKVGAVKGKGHSDLKCEKRFCLKS